MGSSTTEPLLHSSSEDTASFDDGELVPSAKEPRPLVLKVQLSEDPPIFHKIFASRIGGNQPSVQKLRQEIAAKITLVPQQQEQQPKLHRLVYRDGSGDFIDITSDSDLRDAMVNPPAAGGLKLQMVSLPQASKQHWGDKIRACRKEAALARPLLKGALLAALGALLIGARPFSGHKTTAELETEIHRVKSALAQVAARVETLQMEQTITAKEESSEKEVPIYGLDPTDAWCVGECEQYVAGPRRVWLGSHGAKASWDVSDWEPGLYLATVKYFRSSEHGPVSLEAWVVDKDHYEQKGSLKRFNQLPPTGYDHHNLAYSTLTMGVFEFTGMDDEHFVLAYGKSLMLEDGEEEVLDLALRGIELTYLGPQ